MDYCHKRGIKHLDIKTGNVLVDHLKPHHIYVVDFGFNEFLGHSLFFRSKASAVYSYYSSYFGLGILFKSRVIEE